jgi:HD-like signal output (HDOD) protein
MRPTANRSRSFRDELCLVFERAKVPTNPAIAVEILRLAGDPASSAEQFADVIQTDAALVARLLKMVNNALYAQREPVTTIQRAVTILGLRRIRMFALGFQLVTHLDRLGACSFDLRRFWQQSVLRACLAREIAAKITPAHAEEAFVVGLLQDCGILLLVQILGEEYAALYASANLSPTAFYVEEQKQFAHDHVEAISTIASEWNLPEVIAEPLRQHHRRMPLGPDASDVECLSGIAYLVGSLPLVGGQTLALSEPLLRDYARADLALEEAALNDCLARAGQAYRQVARPISTSAGRPATRSGGRRPWRRNATGSARSRCICGPPSGSIASGPPTIPSRVC